MKKDEFRNNSGSQILVRKDYTTSDNTGEKEKKEITEKTDTMTTLLNSIRLFKKQIDNNQKEAIYNQEKLT